MSTLELLLLAAALVFAIVDEVLARGRSWAGWAALCLALALLLGRLA